MTLTQNYLAQRLIEILINDTKNNNKCKALYLHVLNSNFPAIQFYNRNNFIELKFLSKYYYFNNEWHDAYLYAYYINGGKPSSNYLRYPFYAFIYIILFSLIKVTTLEIAFLGYYRVFGSMLHSISLIRR